MMKKLFQAIGMISLICFSFFYTEKAALVVKETDQLLVRIKEQAGQYKVEPKEAIVDGNKVIPGMKGREVDVQKSYQRMKAFGQFQDNLLEYRDIVPKKQLSSYLDHYIVGGNREKNQVSFLFLVDERDSLDSVLSILKEHGLKGNFFVDGLWFEDHNDEISSLIRDGHTIGNLSYQGNYKDSSFIWMDTIIKKIGKQKVSYCYTEKENSEILDVCSMNLDYTILPSYVISNNPLKEIREQVSGGSIIAMPVNNMVIEELPLMIRYIESRGYTLTTLDEHLKE